MSGPHAARAVRLAAVVVPPVGDVVGVALPNPRADVTAFLAEVRGAIGAEALDSARLAGDLTAWVGDSSLLDGSVPNPRVTYLAWFLRVLAGAGHREATASPLAGTVVLTGGVDVEGHETALPDRWLSLFAPWRSLHPGRLDS